MSVNRKAILFLILGGLTLNMAACGNPGTVSKSSVSGLQVITGAAVEMNTHPPYAFSNSANCYGVSVESDEKVIQGERQEGLVQYDLDGELVKVFPVEGIYELVYVDDLRIVYTTEEKDGTTSLWSAPVSEKNGADAVDVDDAVRLCASSDINYILYADENAVVYIDEMNENVRRVEYADGKNSEIKGADIYAGKAVRGEDDTDPYVTDLSEKDGLVLMDYGKLFFYDAAKSEMALVPVQAPIAGFWKNGGIIYYDSPAGGYIRRYNMETGEDTLFLTGEKIRGSMDLYADREIQIASLFFHGDQVYVGVALYGSEGEIADVLFTCSGEDASGLKYEKELSEYLKNVHDKIFPKKYMDQEGYTAETAAFEGIDFPYALIYVRKEGLDGEKGDQYLCYNMETGEEKKIRAGDPEYGF